MLSLTDFYRIKQSSLYWPNSPTLNTLSSLDTVNDYSTRAEKHKNKLRSYDKKYPYHPLLTFENKKIIDPYSVVGKEDDAIKELNILCKHAKIASIRDKQLDERKHMEKEEKEKIEKEKKKEIKNNKEYYPIDVIEINEKYYNLSNESKEDLYPLNTYQVNHGLCIDFLKYEDPFIKTNIPGEITIIGSDYENNLYICTNNGKIIKKTKREEILIQSDKYKESISCINIIDSIVVTGDENGNIALWNNKSLSQVLSNVNDNNKIICIKIIDILNTQLTFIFSDIKGNFNLIKVNNINKNNSDYKNIELEYEYSPIYKIIVFPNNESFIKTQKQNLTLILVSPQNVGIYRLYTDNYSLDKLKLFDYIYGEKGKFYFDVSAGFGFPPVSDLNKGKLGFENPAAAYRGSISTNIMIGSEEEEISMIAISYGTVLQLFGFRVSDKNEIFFKAIGYIINDRPILRNIFVANSMIVLLSDNFSVKLINTYDFVPKVYKQNSDTKITKDFLIAYESLSINNAEIKGDLIGYNVDNKIIQKDILNNKLIVSNSKIYFIIRFTLT